MIYFWLFSSLLGNYKWKTITVEDQLVSVPNDGCPSPKCSIRNIFNIPFESEYYNFCFVDNGESISYPYKVYLVNGNESIDFLIPSEGKFCHIVNLGLGVDTFVSQAHVEINPFKYNKLNNTIVLEIGQKNLEEKVELTSYSASEKLISVFLIYWAFFFLLREVKKYLFESNKNDQKTP